MINLIFQIVCTLFQLMVAYTLFTGKYDTYVSTIIGACGWAMLAGWSTLNAVKAYVAL